MSRWSNCLTLLVALAGCSEQNISVLQQPKEQPMPEIEVTPTALDFGVVTSTEEAVQTFVVKNVGANTLVVEDMELAVGSGAYTILSETGFFLDIDGEQEIEVMFIPGAGAVAQGRIDVLSDDADEPVVPVDLAGSGAEPHLLISPSPLNFGDVLVDCGESGDITLMNVGPEPLVVDDISFKSPDGQMSLVSLPKLPFTLNQTEKVTLTVDYSPTKSGASNGALIVDSNDPDGIKTAVQTGKGISGSTITDDFEIQEDPPVDIIFAVDQSCSMDAVTVPLANAFADFINTIEDVTDGWRIGVVTNDDGCFNVAPFEETYPNYEDKFQDAVGMGGCANGYPTCNTESLFTLTASALAETWTGGCNGNFLRPNALLHIIMVSDEEEQTSQDPKDIANFLAQYQTYVADPSYLKVSAIADVYDACGDGGGNAAGANRYKDMADDSGGISLDVCNEGWSTQTEDLALASLTHINDFGLSQDPDEDTLEVYVDGQKWLSGWVYDPAKNSVRFTDVMDPGQEIEVTYELPQSCP